ncbi:MAG: methyltransferase domain-containing protein [Pseudomonadota bacterium]
MQANSTPVTSSQSGPHRQLHALVARHATSQFQKPIASYNQSAFQCGMAAWQAAGQAPMILDAGCGVGVSTLHLARQFPDHFVIGVDQSANRLERNSLWTGELPANHILLRADLVDFWRLLAQAKIRLARHYVLYPNPWPKIGQLARRWHGHAVFPTLLKLGGVLECRSNWRIYVEEFAAGLSQLQPVSSQLLQVEQYRTDHPITPFERKYLASGHVLWRCQTMLA